NVMPIALGDWIVPDAETVDCTTPRSAVTRRTGGGALAGGPTTRIAPITAASASGASRRLVHGEVVRASGGPEPTSASAPAPCRDASGERIGISDRQPSRIAVK